MIYGIGTDLCDIARIAKLLEKQGEKLIQRVLTPQEIAAAPHPIPAHFIAKRWAAKEALSKALGTGIGENLSFQDINIQRKISGQPTLHLHPSHPQSTLKFHLSLSDEENYALAYVIAEESS